MTEMAAVAKRFAEGRQDNAGFADFPGRLPGSLAEAYAVQDAAIALWRKPVAGWKVGRIMGAAEQAHGENRFVGPIFADAIWPIDIEQEAQFPAIPGGFAALEAELIARVSPPSGEGQVSARDCEDFVSAWHVGIEVAGSPCAAINDLGPLASIAGFGNNIGLFIGPQITSARPDDVRCSVTIDDNAPVERRAGDLPGGPLEAVAFAINKLRALGGDLSSDLLISTGAITGVHPVRAGQHCTARFTPGGDLRCRVTHIAD